MDYTPRYDRGIASILDASVIADPTEVYRADSNFSGSDGDVEQHRVLPFYVPGSMLAQTMNLLPRASQITLLVQQSSSGVTAQFGTAFELVVAAQGQLAQPVAVAWVDGFTDAPNVGAWVMTLSGIDAPLAIYAKSGLPSGQLGTSSISVFAYLQNIAVPTRDRINPLCTVPPFDLAGNHLFSAMSLANRRPSKQVVQNQREYFGQLQSLSIATGTIRRMNVFGGPWIGQMTHTVDTATLLAEVKGMDAEQLGAIVGYSIDTDNSQRGIVQIADPLRYDWTQFSVEGTDTFQEFSLRIALTSPTQ